MQGVGVRALNAGAGLISAKLWSSTVIGVVDVGGCVESVCGILRRWRARSGVGASRPVGVGAREVDARAEECAPVVDGVYACSGVAETWRLRSESMIVSIRGHRSTCSPQRCTNQRYSLPGSNCMDLVFGP